MCLYVIKDIKTGEVLFFGYSPCYALAIYDYKDNLILENLKNTYCEITEVKK